MNKSFLVFFAIILLTSFVFAEDIAYIKDGILNSNDNVIIDLLNDYYFVDIIDKDENIGDYDVYIVAESVNDIEGVIDNTNVKTFFLSKNAGKKIGLSASNGLTSGKEITILNNDNEITQGFDLDKLKVYSSYGEINYLSGCRAINQEDLAYKTSTTRGIIIAFKKGSLLLDDTCTQRTKELYERNVYFGLIDAEKWNSDAQTLFLNSVEWLITEDDNDGDGYDLIEDCDDNNPFIYPGAEEILDNIDQNCINDAPEFDLLNPDYDDVMIFIGTEKLFEINVNDVDGDDVMVSWFLDDEEVGSDNEYLFDGFDMQGDYNLRVRISDGELENTYLWDVFVGGEEYFTCQEVGGYLCDFEIEVCSGDLWDVFDTNNCCNVACSEKPPEFKDIDDRRALTGGLEIIINNIAENEVFKIEELISIDIDIKNNIDEDIDAEVSVYLYDVNEDEIIYEEVDSMNIRKNRKSNIDFEMSFPEDIDVDNVYYLFIKADADDYYEEKFIKIRPKKEDHRVIIEQVKLSESNYLVCGDYLDINVNVKNIGSYNEDVYVKLKSSDLKIDIINPLFELGENDDSDEKFSLKLLDNLEVGDYKLTITVFYGSSRDYVEQIIKISDCKTEVVDVNNMKVIGLSRIDSPALEKRSSFSLKSAGLILLMVLSLMAFAGIISYIVFIVYRG